MSQHRAPDFAVDEQILKNIHSVPFELLLQVMLLAPHQAVVPVKDQNLPKGRPFLLLKKFEIRGKIINPVLLYKLSAGCQFFRGSLQFTLRDPEKSLKFFTEAPT